MDNSTSQSFDHDSAAARSRETLGALREATGKVLSSRRCRIEELERQLSDQFDAIDHVLSENAGHIDESKRQAAESAARQREELEAELEQLRRASEETLQQQAEVQDERQRQLDEREQAIQSLEQELEARVTELDAREAAHGVREEDLLRGEQELHAGRTELAERSDGIDLREAELAARETALDEREAKTEAEGASQQRLAEDLAARESALEAGQGELQEARGQLEAERAELLEQQEEVASRGERISRREEELEQRTQDREVGSGESDALREQLASVTQELAAVQEELAASQEARHREKEELERLQEQAAAEPAGLDSEALADLQSRFEMAVEDVRNLKSENESLREQLAAATEQSVPGGGGLNWEAQKRQLLESLEEDGGNGGEAAQQERTTIESTIRITDEVIARKDREIEELKDQLAAGVPLAAGRSGKEATSYGRVAGPGEETGDGELKTLRDQLQEKLREAELELSVGRAKVAREQAELDSLRQELKEQREMLLSTPRPAPGSAGAPPTRRWLAKLGLSGNDEV